MHWGLWFVSHSHKPPLAVTGPWTLTWRRSGCFPLPSSSSSETHESHFICRVSIDSERLPTKKVNLTLIFQQPREAWPSIVACVCLRPPPGGKLRHCSLRSKRGAEPLVKPEHQPEQERFLKVGVVNFLFILLLLCLLFFYFSMHVFLKFQITIDSLGSRPISIQTGCGSQSSRCLAEICKLNYPSQCQRDCFHLFSVVVFHQYAISWLKLMRKSEFATLRNTKHHKNLPFQIQHSSVLLYLFTFSPPRVRRR